MQIQNYKIISLLGAGRMANVYLAYDSKFDTNVAIKLLNKEYIHNENIRNFFLAEAKIMFRMSHPNIIKVTDLIDNQNKRLKELSVELNRTVASIKGRKKILKLTINDKWGEDELKKLKSFYSNSSKETLLKLFTTRTWSD